MFNEDCLIERVSSSFVCEEFPNDDFERIVIWSNGFRKPVRKNTQQKVFVVTKRLIKSSQASNVEYFPIGVSHMTNVTVGSVWQNRKHVGNVKSSPMSFKLNNNNCEFILLSEAITRFGAPEQLEQLYHERKLGNAWMLNFQTTSNQNVLVPCIEYFLRTYGVSGALRRILVTDRYDPVGKMKLFPPFTRIEGGPRCQLMKPSGGFVRNDCFFLASVKNSKYSEMAAKEVYANIEASYRSQTNLSLPKIRPWFEGRCTVKVEGEFVSSGCFWSWKVNGISLPKSEDILFISEKPVRRPSGEQEEEQTAGGRGIFRKPPRNAPNPLPLVDEHPDDDSASFLMPGETVELLGNVPTIEVKTIDKEIDSGNGRNEKEDAKKASGGSRKGNGKGVGKATTYLDVEFNDGVIMEVWNALHSMSGFYSPELQKISWVLVESGEFVTGRGEPQPILLDDLKDCEKKVTPGWVKKAFSNIDEAKHYAACQRWIGSFFGERNRGVFVFSVHIDGVRYLLLEIEREITIDADGIEKEGSYKGLIYKPNEEIEGTAWLTKLLADIRLSKGVFKLVPQGAEVFYHRPSQNSLFKGENVVKNAFGKLGVSFKKLKE